MFWSFHLSGHSEEKLLSVQMRTNSITWIRSHLFIDFVRKFEFHLPGISTMLSYKRGWKEEHGIHDIFTQMKELVV